MIFTGSSKDGRDIRVARGAYINPDNPDEWSSQPYLSQRVEASKYERLVSHINGKRTVLDELELIKNKKSTLSKSMRDYVIQLCEESCQV